MHKLSMLFLLATLAGCASPGVHELPSEKPAQPEPQQSTLPTAWKHAPAAEAPSNISPWWKALNDAALNELVAQAHTSNPDIRIAETRLNEIGTTVAGAEADEQVTAAAELSAAENDLRAVKLEVAHAMTSAYADARLAEHRKTILLQRIELTRDLTALLHRKLKAGLITTHTLREAEQSEIEMHQALAKTHHDHQLAVAKLALMSGLAPIEFKLPAGGNLFAGQLSLQTDLPGTVINRRPDVQAAWQRLLSATSTDMDDDGLPLTARVEQAAASPAGRDALYRKAVLAALQDVETTVAGWRLSVNEARSTQAFLEIQTANMHDMERELGAGRVSRADLLKTMLSQNIAQENALLALHAQCVAFASAQLALAQD